MRGASCCGCEAPLYLHHRHVRFDTLGVCNVLLAVTGCTTDETSNGGAGLLLPVEVRPVVPVDRTAGVTILENHGASACGQ